MKQWTPRIKLFLYHLMCEYIIVFVMSVHAVAHDFTTAELAMLAMRLCLLIAFCSMSAVMLVLGVTEDVIDMTKALKHGRKVDKELQDARKNSLSMMSGTT